MLYLHQSNQLEQLARHFAALQQIDPLAPLETEQVVVQNSGMGRWLSLEIARFTGIAANIRYLFPAELTWELLRKVLVDVPERDPCAPTTLRWRLLDIFLQEPDAWPDLAHYLSTGEEGAWQLAGQIAKVFDQYLFFRPDWIRGWEQGKGVGDDWQARLWWRVAGEQKLPHWVRLQERFTHAISVVDKSLLPKRICLFSVPVLSPGYVQLLGEVAKHVDIHIYLMNPCLEYWGDIESEKRKRKRAANEQDLITVGNPLLASWGRQGRDFMDLLIEANADTDSLVQFVEPDENTLLRRVQADILLLRMPELLSVPPDNSIRFHACHSPMREAEVLYEQLLALFEANPDLTPADVVVMTPDIDTYAPYLDAVFSTAPFPLPFSIADRSPGYAQGVLNLCQQLLELPQSRCDTETVLALLEFEEVRSHLGLDEAQVMQCREWIRAVNIRWGTDARTRPQQGGAATPEHTWRYGLDRLLLGYALPGDELFAGVLPYNEIEGSQAEMLGRLQNMLDVIFDLALWDGQQQQLAVWDQRLRQVLKTVVGEDAPLQPVWQALDNLQKTLEQAAFDQPLAWPVFRSALAEQLDKRSESDGFLGRGITFCALMPMRTVPFRFVGLVGMNDGVFPRRDVRASFDRMGQKIHRGDRLKRDEDRYLYLESILSARDWLYISYVGQSPHDNSELPPSVLVSELLDYLERCEEGSRKARVTKHPLQAFSGKYPAGRLLSLPFWQGVPLPEPDLHYRQLSLADLIRFYQHPARAFLRARFGLHLGERDYELPIREPFTLEGYSDTDVRDCIFQQLAKALPAGNALPLLRAQGLLPHGKPGDLLFAREAGVTQTFFDSIQPLPEVRREAFSLVLGDFRLTGVVGQLGSEGRKVYTLGKLSYWQWLDIWLHHLVLNTLDVADCPHQTLVFSPEKNQRLEPVADAAGQLEQLLAWYWQGLQEPLPFFPKTGFKLMDNSEPEISKAMSTWEGSGGFMGESQKPEYRLLYREGNPLETQAEDFMSIAQGIFGQMFSVMK
jgi:exodeoxyribonuclease V gamma subunit